MTETVSKVKRPRHIIRKIVITLLMIIAAVIIGFNIYIRVSCSAFYAEAKAEFPVPDSHSGFVVQDLDHIDKADMWLFSGYMSNSDVAPLIRRDAAGAISKIYVKLLDGQLYGMHHGSGITSTDDYTFLTTDSGYVVMKTDDLVAAHDGDTVNVIAERELGLGPAFLSISDGVLYTGEFYYPGAYETPEEHHLTAPDGTENTAIMYAFDANPEGFYGFDEMPSRIYSIPDKVQGVCVVDGKLVLSCSWGVSNSTLRVYDLKEIIEEGTFALSLEDALGNPTPSPYKDTITFNPENANSADANSEDASLENINPSGIDPTTGSSVGAHGMNAREAQSSKAFSPAFIDIPLYYLDSSSFLENVIAPPMSEGITVFDGRVYIPNESASNKYIFGKLILGGDMIYSLPL